MIKISKDIHSLSRILLMLIVMAFIPVQDDNHQEQNFKKVFEKNILRKWVLKTKIRKIRFSQNNFGISKKQLIHSIV